MNLDDLDIYHDLREFKHGEDKKSKELLAAEAKQAEAREELEKLKIENKDIKKNIKKMEMNFQILLNTARAEINRKDRQIEELQKEKYECFRRKQSSIYAPHGVQDKEFCTSSVNPFRSKISGSAKYASGKTSNDSKNERLPAHTKKGSNNRLSQCNVNELSRKPMKDSHINKDKSSDSGYHPHQEIDFWNDSNRKNNEIFEHKFEPPSLNTALWERRRGLNIYKSNEAKDRINGYQTNIIDFRSSNDIHSNRGYRSYREESINEKRERNTKF